MEGWDSEWMDEKADEHCPIDRWLDEWNATTEFRIEEQIVEGRFDGRVGFPQSLHDEYF